MILLRAAVALRNLLTTYIHKEISMSENASSSVMFACPPAALASLKVWMRDNAAIPVESFDLALRIGAEGTAYADAPMLFGAMQMKAAQIELLRASVSPEGDLYALGVRARRRIFPPQETTTNEAGKLQVDVIDAGQPIPAGMTAEAWATTRLTLDRFLEELGAPGAALIVLEAPEPAI